MSKTDVHQKLNRAFETTLGVKGRKPGKDIPKADMVYTRRQHCLFDSKSGL
jgi:hypothetical protein